MMWSIAIIAVTLALIWMAYAMRDYGRISEENSDYESREKERGLIRRMRDRARADWLRAKNRK